MSIGGVIMALEVWIVIEAFCVIGLLSKKPSGDAV